MELIESTTSAPVAHVVETLQASLARRRIEVFAVIDHAAAARAAGLELADETVIVFGNPAVGTTLMRADPYSGLDLPLRILVWSDGGRTHVAYRDISALAGEFDLANAAPTLEKLGGLLSELVDEVTR